MRNPKRKTAFVLAASEHGTMIVNRLDYHIVDQRIGIGVGFQILEGAMFDPEEVDMALTLLGCAGAISVMAWWRWIAAPISGCTPSSGRNG
jgi:hypothetical protein